MTPGVALDPRRSVVVEACAGSGKTWLLVSRLIRLLLEGVPPGAILAISFTRKAAREIEARLLEWLEFLATGTDEAVREFLVARGLDAAQAEALRPRARGLVEALRAASPPLTVTTFHGWFARLVDGAPLASDLAGFMLHESSVRLREEVWQRFADDCARRRDGVTESLLWLLGAIGPAQARELAFRFAERQAEWHACAAGGVTPLDSVLARLRAELAIGETPAVSAFFAAPDRAGELREFGALLARSETATDQAAAACLAQAAGIADEEARFEQVCGVFLNADGEPRARKAGPTLTRRYGADAARFLALHARLGEALCAAMAARADETAWAFNRHALTVCAAYLEALEAFKRERRLMDFGDLEWHVARMLAEEDQAAFLQARLDARYRHILLDEFQDTNPLQWQILLAWLDAYAPTEARPSLFVVGDPKQSIYRFRRADPRVFVEAGAFLGARYEARRVEVDATRRNAPAIVDVVNRLFQDEATFQPFRRHEALESRLPGRVEVFPLCGAAPAAAPQALRDPLAEPRRVAEDERRRGEAVQLAAGIRERVGRWPVVDRRTGRERPMRFGDMMVLTRRRGVLPEFEAALRAARIPYLSVGRGGLLQTLEAADFVALLACLVTPGANLELAHALRAPTLGATDADLLWLAAREEPDWWQRVQAASDAAQAPAALRRAGQLLATWRERAGALPVHDLLDRIYHEGEVMDRYRQAVPETMWPGVAANLEAFIELALDLDAGRYPSLPRFLDELARLGRRGEEEAPDEGMLRGEEAGDRVRVLTIHGAKGLEAPAVWLIDAQGGPARSDPWSVLLDWPPGEPRPTHFSLSGRKEERGRRREARFRAEAEAAAREELNLLYVAVTRARQYFFASGIEGRGADAGPWRRLHEAVARLGGEDGAWGAPPVALAGAVQTTPAATSAPSPEAAPIGVGRRRDAASAGMRYGERLHAALDWLTGPGRDGQGPPPGVAREDWTGLRREARAILDDPRYRRFFDPSAFRQAWNEVEFALPEGGIGRIDRLVEAEDGLWVLDYKSGAPEAALDGAYRRQLESYRAAVNALFPGRSVRCGLIYASGAWAELEPA